MLCFGDSHSDVGLKKYLLCTNWERMRATVLMCWHYPGMLVVMRLKWVGIFSCVSNLLKPFSRCDSSQNETLFQEKTVGDENVLIPLSSVLHPFFPCQIQLSSPHPTPSCVYYSHTLTHCFTPWSSFPVLSHVSLFAPPLTPRCVSL